MEREIVIQLQDSAQQLKNANVYYFAIFIVGCMVFTRLGRIARALEKANDQASSKK